MLLDRSPLSALGTPAEAAPWWGVPVIAGAFLILGGAIGFWSNWRLEARKQTRAEALRWDADIRQYAAELLGAIREGLRERIRRDAFTAGHAWALRNQLKEKSPDEINLLVDDGEDLESYIKRDTHFRRHDAPFFKESEQRSAASWDHIESLTASLSLIAPAAIRTSADGLVASLDVALRTDDDYDVPTDAHVAVSEAREGLIAAVRQHLGLYGHPPTLRAINPATLGPSHESKGNRSA